MKNILANWKTTSAGVALILGALTDMVTAMSHGVITPNLSADFTAIVGGAGLIFAGDASAPPKS